MYEGPGSSGGAACQSGASPLPRTHGLILRPCHSQVVIWKPRHRVFCDGHLSGSQRRAYSGQPPCRVASLTPMASFSVFSVQAGTAPHASNWGAAVCLGRATPTDDVVIKVHTHCFYKSSLSRLYTESPPCRPTSEPGSLGLHAGVASGTGRAGGRELADGDATCVEGAGQTASAQMFSLQLSFYAESVCNLVSCLIYIKNCFWLQELLYSSGLEGRAYL